MYTNNSFSKSLPNKTYSLETKRTLENGSSIGMQYHNVNTLHMNKGHSINIQQTTINQKSSHTCIKFWLKRAY